jgi:hypothetical protein
MFLNLDTLSQSLPILTLFIFLSTDIKMSVDRTGEMGATLLSLNVLKFCRRNEIWRCFKREWFQENGQQQHDDRLEHFVIKITDESCVLCEMSVPAHYTYNWKAWEALGSLSVVTDDGIVLRY